MEIASTSLKGTAWEWTYTIFGRQNDQLLCQLMAHIGLAYTTVVGIYSLFNPAPYGRYSSAKFGPTINAKLAWMIQESPAFVIPILLALTTPHLQLGNWTNYVALSMFIGHYFQRSFIFPFLLGKTAKPVPLVTVLAADVFCVYNGFLQGHYLSNTATIPNSYLSYFVGLPLFILGMGINITHDRMLIALREQAATGHEPTTAPGQEQESTASRYKIPRSYLFEYISGANYFGEILEWWGFALFTRGYPQIAFAIFSTTFLGIRAIHHHKFYKKTFGKRYPANRTAIIPFIL